ncbi:Ethylene-responsive transcription factor Related to AP22-2 [Forsythia ovata]|uniref:Ethylene-responsive transcription factor Related to AP22-2 n=1 Tax=Forsythia ovata TaxID=205694 RepID=A0ABD1WBX1_9LAMI
MCGRAIISNLLAPNRSSRLLIVDLLWRSGGGADLINSKKKVSRNCHSKPLRSKPVVDIDNDFEADFKEFKDYSDDEVEINVNPFAFSASKNSSLRGSKFVKSLSPKRMLKSHQKRKRKNQYRGIRQRPWVNGLLRFETIEKVSEFGLELLTLLRKLQELMILRLSRSGTKRLR